MTAEEKEKLFRAIDYQENTAPLHLPNSYVAVEGQFKLQRLQLAVRHTEDVLKARVDDVTIGFAQRPSANALRYVSAPPHLPNSCVFRSVDLKRTKPICLELM